MLCNQERYQLIDVQAMKFACEASGNNAIMLYIYNKHIDDKTCTAH